MIGYKSFDDTYPVGSVVITSTNTAPAFSGTWTLINKEFSDLYVNNYNGYLTINTTNTTSVTNFIAIRTGRMISFRIVFVPKVDLTDATLEFATVNLSALGLAGSFQVYFTGYSDGSNGIAQMALTADGRLESLDVITKTSGGTFPAGNAINLVINLPVIRNNMMDSACDKFYWKRTA